jgi:hypothetical protein
MISGAPLRRLRKCALRTFVVSGQSSYINPRAKSSWLEKLECCTRYLRLRTGWLRVRRIGEVLVSRANAVTLKALVAVFGGGVNGAKTAVTSCRIDPKHVRVFELPTRARDRLG